MKLIKWFGGLLEDQGKSVSSKRLTLYIFTYFFYLEVQASIAGKAVDETVLYSTVAVILFTVGAVTGEFITDILGRKKKEEK